MDPLVVERDLENGLQENVRVARLAGERRLPADVVVVSEAQLEESGSVPETMPHDALAEGRVLAEA